MEGWKRERRGRMEGVSNRMCYSIIKMYGVRRRRMDGSREGVVEVAQSRMNVLRESNTLFATTGTI